MREIRKNKKKKKKNEQVKPGSKGPYRVQRKIKAVIEETEGNREGNARTEKKKGEFRCGGGRFKGASRNSEFTSFLSLSLSLSLFFKTPFLFLYGA